MTVLSSKNSAPCFVAFFNIAFPANQSTESGAAAEAAGASAEAAGAAGSAGAAAFRRRKRILDPLMFLPFCEWW